MQSQHAVQHGAEYTSWTHQMLMLWTALRSCQQSNVYCICIQPRHEKQLVTCRERQIKFDVMDDTHLNCFGDLVIGALKHQVAEAARLARQGGSADAQN